VVDQTAASSLICVVGQTAVRGLIRVLYRLESIQRHSRGDYPLIDQTAVRCLICVVVQTAVKGLYMHD
jgi:hypothetical protein